MRIEEVRSEHPGLADKAYLDTSSCGLLARSTVDDAWKEQERLMIEGSGRYAYWREGGMATVARAVADSIGADEAGMAMVPSFTTGLALLASLLAHRPKVLLVNGDYPTLHAPFATGGFDIVRLDPSPDGAIGTDELGSMVARERPDIVAVSHVQWTTGHRMDLDLLSLICTAHGAWSLVDATQSWCSVPIDVSGSGIDIIGASGYKWPLAGFGNGFMHLSAHVRAEIDARWGVDPVAHLTSGHVDPVAMVRLQEALGRIERIGITDIAAHVSGLADEAVAALDRAGIPVIHGRTADRRAGIIVFEGGPERLARMKAHGVQAALRGAGIRIGIHFYNSVTDIERLAEALEH